MQRNDIITMPNRERFRRVALIHINSGVFKGQTGWLLQATVNPRQPECGSTIEVDGFIVNLPPDAFN
ncbi:MAG TPA: hypothetical protein VGN17_00520 [Bryobacteraceae bacterium]|jgi:hypothetical protein